MRAKKGLESGCIILASATLVLKSAFYMHSCGNTDPEVSLGSKQTAQQLLWPWHRVVWLRGCTWRTLAAD